MNIIALDDEEFALATLNDAICEALPNEQPVCFGKAEDALEYAKQVPVDVAFLDINMDGMSGIELAEKLMELCPTTNLIFVTGFSEYFDKAFELYASGYVKKPVRAKRILREMAHLRYPLRAETSTTHLQKLSGIYTFDYRAERVYKNGKDAMLTPKEYKLFLLLVDNIGAFLDAESIYQKLWVNDPNGDLRTVYKHVYKLRGKLEMDSESDFDIETKRGIGYRLMWQGKCSS